ncbi:GTP-binding protein [Crocosphaera sp. XPORK-15E]|uniref:GTP-binding protein n=1 Tax=Crocosphaera sp. XPORK-15E TaxID=3110247 RepID=UPI002B202E91|nr:GTP-binding protein [Crocosphaera sp. XPORK-15E]MEA5535440.1 GTP-binding protein [Crocosphaera sp. XPORK-15E]
MKTINKKICLLGHFHAGKTSLVIQFLEKRFQNYYGADLGVKIFETCHQFHEDQTLNLSIWDIAGSVDEYFPNPVYLAGTHGVIIVTDISQTDALDHVNSYLHWLDTLTDIPLKIAIALNKCDLIDTADLSLDYFPTNPLVIKTYETSAKTGKNVNIIFQELFNHLWDSPSIP